MIARSAESRKTPYARGLTGGNELTQGIPRAPALKTMTSAEFRGVKSRQGLRDTRVIGGSGARNVGRPAEKPVM
ncbi:hypothetical protein V5799_029407 [Amblyomma americanum]|uniref:Uncharacterized protein n=1 Tax=Amblyomma americanum TaxID=6943 RepID=A0AAQ4ERG7_AMBAM